MFIVTDLVSLIKVLQSLMLYTHHCHTIIYVLQSSIPYTHNCLALINDSHTKSHIIQFMHSLTLSYNHQCCLINSLYSLIHSSCPTKGPLRLSKGRYDETFAGEDVIHNGVDFIFLSFWIMGFIVEL